MYYFIGPLVALVISLKYTSHMTKKQEEQLRSLAAEIELVAKQNETLDKEILQKVMTTVLPVAKAVNKLNQEVGIR